MSEVTNIPQLRFPEFGGEWEEKRFDLLYPTVRNGFVGVATPYYVEKGVSYLQGKNIKSGTINKEGLIYISEYFHQKSKKSQLRKNDIVMVQSGHVGECAVITEEFEDTNCHALLVSTPTHDIDSKFYINYFYSKFGRKKIHRITTGNTIKHILSSDLKIQIVSNPSYQEQQKIAAFLTSVDNKIEFLRQKQELLGEYKKGVMQQIFSQTIRFKADDGSEFPEWEEKKLGSVGSFKSGTGFTESEQGGILGVPFFKVSDMNLAGNQKIMLSANNYVSDEQITRLNYKPINKKSIIFAKVGAAVFLERKRIANNFLIDNNMMAFTPTEDIGFIRQWFDTIRLSKYAQVGALPSYNASDLKTIKINLPSLVEQTKIANFLSSIDSKIEQMGKQLDESKQFKKALLQQMFV